MPSRASFILLALREREKGETTHAEALLRRAPGALRSWPRGVCKLTDIGRLFAGRERPLMDGEGS